MNVSNKKRTSQWAIYMPWILQILTFMAVVLLYIYRSWEKNGNMYLSVVLLSALSNYWWQGAREMAADEETQKHLLALSIFLTSINFIFIAQWYVLDQKAVFLDGKQAMFYGLTWVLVHLSIALYFYEKISQTSGKKHMDLKALLRNEQKKLKRQKPPNDLNPIKKK